MKCAPIDRSPRGGFTLAEAAITIAIVALVISFMLQSMQGAKTSAAHTRYKKTAWELGMGMLGEISAGLWMEEIESGITGTFADVDEPDYGWEIALGEDALETNDANGDERPFDNYAARRDWEERQDDYDEEEEEEAEEPFEKVKLRVTYPSLEDFSSDLVLEAWIPWDQVYGAEEEDDELAGGTNVGGPIGANSGEGEGQGAGQGGGG